MNDTGGEAALTRRVANGDRAALAEAFDRFAPTLTRYAWAAASSRSDVEELVQDTFWQKSETFALPTGSLLPWLLVVCRNHARNLVRKRTRNAAAELPEDLVGAPDAEEAREQLRWVLDHVRDRPRLRARQGHVGRRGLDAAVRVLWMTGASGSRVIG